MSFRFGFSDVARLGAELINIQPLPEDEVVATTYLGNPVRDNLVFPAEGNESIGLSEDFVVNDIIVRIERTKNIIKTIVQGRPGVVNEFISQGDYILTIDGLVVSPDQYVRPVDELRVIKALDDFEGPVAVASKFLSIYEIQTVVIDRIEVIQRPGFYNQLPFVMQCRSDTPIELQIQDASTQQ